MHAVTARPDRVVVVAGTGTEVGKTWCAARIIEHLRAAGVTVGARKPAQSFDPDDPTHDAAVLSAAGEAEDDVCAPSCPVAFAPLMAAAALGRPPPFLSELVAASSSWPTPARDRPWSGRWRPLALPATATASPYRRVVPDSVLLVADAGLGTINSVRPTVEALASQCRVPVVVLLNRYDPGVGSRAHRPRHPPRWSDVVTPPRRRRQRARVSAPRPPPEPPEPRTDLPPARRWA